MQIIFCKVYPKTCNAKITFPKNFKFLSYNSRKFLPVRCFTFLKMLIAANSDKYQKEEKNLSQEGRY